MDAAQKRHRIAFPGKEVLNGPTKTPGAFVVRIENEKCISQHDQESAG